MRATGSQLAALSATLAAQQRPTSQVPAAVHEVVEHQLLAGCAVIAGAQTLATAGGVPAEDGLVLGRGGAALLRPPAFDFITRLDSVGDSGSSVSAGSGAEDASGRPSPMAGGGGKGIPPHGGGAGAGGGGGRGSGYSRLGRLVEEEGVEGGGLGMEDKDGSEDYEEVTFDRCFYIYGGPEHMEVSARMHVVACLGIRALCVLEVFYECTRACIAYGE